MKFIVIIATLLTFIMPIEQEVTSINDDLPETPILSEELILIRPGIEYINEFMTYQDKIDELMDLLERVASEDVASGEGHNFYISPPGNYVVFWGYGERPGMAILLINRGDFTATNIFADIKIIIDAENNDVLGNFFIHLPRETWGVIYPNTAMPVFVELSQAQVKVLSAKLKYTELLSVMMIVFGELGLKVEDADTGDLFAIERDAY